MISYDFSDKGSCAGCNTLLTIYLSRGFEQATYEQILDAMANSFCYWCNRKPEEARKLATNPIPRDCEYNQWENCTLDESIRHAGTILSSEQNRKQYSQESLERIEEFLDNMKVE